MASINWFSLELETCLKFSIPIIPSKIALVMKFLVELPKLSIALKFGSVVKLGGKVASLRTTIILFYTL